ncbi:MAG TPA: hypothetical protein VH062_10840 [Polyangiaceae bacterium]|jgi:hypothetical protein|nr:hypothetical protein [Polyangiaceae bacterium]
MSDVNLVLMDSAVYLGTYRNVTLIDVGGVCDLVHMKAIGSAYRALLDLYPRGIVALSYLRPGTPVSPADARAESARFVRELGDSILFSAMVVEGEGVLPQMLRTVIRGVNVLARMPRINVYSRGDEAIRQVVQYMVPGGDDVEPVAELTSVVRRVRTAFRPSRRVTLTSRP